MQSSDYTKIIKENVKISDILGQYGHVLNRANKCRCPFHNEKTASFTVSKDDTKYKCFGCGIYGDAIDLIGRFENCGFKESILILNERFALGLSFGKPKYRDIKKQAMRRDFMVDMTDIYKGRRKEYYSIIDLRRTLNHVLVTYPESPNRDFLNRKIDELDSLLDFLNETIEWWGGKN